MPRLNPFVRVLVNEARRLWLSYTQVNEYAKQARKLLGLRPARGPQSLPRLLSKASLARFYEAIDTAQNIKHQIMLRLLFYTALRVSELCRIEIADVDLAENKIFIK